MMMIDNKFIGLRLKETRKNLGLNIDEVTNLCDLSKSTYIDIEKGRKRITLPTFIKVIKGLNISADFILNKHLDYNKRYLISDLIKMIEGLPTADKQIVLDMILVMVNNFERQD